MSDPDFLTVEDVLLLHEQQLARHGGSADLLDPGTLDSAVATAMAMIDLAERRLDKDGLVPCRGGSDRLQGT